MACVFIIGATGGIGLRLATQLIDRGDHLIGLHRRPEQAQILQTNGTVGELIFVGAIRWVAPGKSPTCPYGCIVL